LGDIQEGMIMLLIVFLLCSSPEPQAAILIVDSKIEQAIKGPATGEFVYELSDIPTQYVHVEKALDGFNCV